MGPLFIKVSSKRLEKRGIDLANLRLVVQRVIHNTSAPPHFLGKQLCYFKVYLNMYQLVKKRKICSLRSKFLFFNV